MFEYIRETLMDKISSGSSFYKVATIIYQPLSVKNLVKWLTFPLAVRKHTSVINNFIARLDRVGIPATSEVVGAITWPYIHNQWDVEN